MQHNSHFAKFFCNNQNIFWGTALVCVSKLGNYSSLLFQSQQNFYIPLTRKSES